MLQPPQVKASFSPSAAHPWGPLPSAAAEPPPGRTLLGIEAFFLYPLWGRDGGSLLGGRLLALC